MNVEPVYQQGRLHVRVVGSGGDGGDDEREVGELYTMQIKSEQRPNRHAIAWS